MEYIKDDEGKHYEIVPWHSKQKHEFLRRYLSIWTEMVGNHSKSVPTLDIIDLYASWGQCSCKENGEKWPGTAKLAAECLTKYERPRLLFLNTYNPNPDHLKLQEENLVDILQDYTIEKKITTLPIEDAVDVALEEANLNFPTLWLLDPYGPKQLPWEVVEKICSAKRTYKNKSGESCDRKPEVLINLMTSSLQREIHNKNLICNSLGITEAEWKDLELRANKSGNAREVLVDAYIERLSQFYEKAPIKFLVTGNHKNVVYTLLLFTDSNAGHYVTKKYKLPDFYKWLEVEWSRSAKEIVAKKKLHHTQSSFDSFL
ncbi:MAG: hypothetical protein AWU58_489 [Methanohalophilus sp. T328-1]|jgi:three-Cys-motif partner protein|nr:MAG: hypothetical protein AWU58_489 [Methanohalophilus sp. T328-1]